MSELSNEQKNVLKKIIANLRSGKEEQTLGGYAGTGKTSMIRYIKHFFPNYAVCAYTGKAANVLRRKNVSASTIHSLIYKPFLNENNEVYFALTDDLDVEGIIIDEASMVPEDIYKDLKSFKIPLLFVGDHGQLEPIGSDFNLMKNPDYKLETIHRNAGEIARFAHHLRNGYSARSFKSIEGKVHLFYEKDLKDDLLVYVDQIICAFNKTRVYLNNKCRYIKGYKKLLEENEKIICLRNNKNLALFNGMQAIVKSFYKDRKGHYYCDFKSQDFFYSKVWIDINQFGKEKNEFEFGANTPNPFDYGQTISCHKAQGDEWDSVLVIEQNSNKWDQRRWNYTAASRAINELFWKLA